MTHPKKRRLAMAMVAGPTTSSRSFTTTDGLVGPSGKGPFTWWRSAAGSGRTGLSSIWAR